MACPGEAARHRESLLCMSIPEHVQRQAGIVARWQLVRDDLLVARREVRARRWQRVGRCYVAQNGPITDLQWHWIAGRNAGVTAALAGRRATAAAGLRGWSDGLLHVLDDGGASTP